FAFTPLVHDTDAWWQMKKHKARPPTTGFRSIHMPGNTAVGIFLAAWSLVLGFASVWHMQILSALSFVGIVATVLAYSSGWARARDVPADVVEATERLARTQ
ncbi:TPA: cytochrome o ubiquinol oxidase subunit I, partial [Burkholderia cenocepacia]